MKRSRRTVLICFLCLALLLAGLLIDSNSRIAVTEYSLTSDKLPAAFSGYRIAQLSDIHGKDFGGRLAENTAGLSPDIIVITGDMADRDTDMSVLDSLLEQLCAIAPVYYISGNHEWGEGLIDEVAALLDKHGGVYLRNEYISLSRGEDSILLAGVEDPNGRFDMPSPIEVVQNMRAEAGDGFCLLLGHRNFWATKYPGLDVDAVMCGHAHGGIVRLPGLGGVLGTGFEFFPDYVDGMHSVGDYSLIISRGLGNSAGIPRFLNNPEIVLLTLECG